MSLCVLTSLRTLRDLSASSTPRSFEDLACASPSPYKSEPFLLRWTFPLPNCTLTVERSRGPSLSCATALAICHQWTCSCISSKRRAQARSCGLASTVLLERCCWRSSSSPIRASRSTSSKCGVTGGTPLSWTGFLFTGRRSPISRSPGISRTYLLKSRRCATSFLAFKHLLTRWSCSNLSSALRPSRVILVCCLTMLFLVYLHTVLIYFLCIAFFLRRHGTKRGEEEDASWGNLQTQSLCWPL